MLYKKKSEKYHMQCERVVCSLLPIGLHKLYHLEVWKPYDFINGEENRCSCLKWLRDICLNVCHEPIL